ncbi:MAG: hypothetical protein GY930_00835 [bacterium]|nr:hypothetical protein [bacterium]
MQNALVLGGRRNLKQPLFITVCRRPTLAGFSVIVRVTYEDQGRSGNGGVRAPHDLPSDMETEVCFYIEDILCS